MSTGEFSCGWPWPGLANCSHDMHTAPTGPAVAQWPPFRTLTTDDLEGSPAQAVAAWRDAESLSDLEIDGLIHNADNGVAVNGVYFRLLKTLLETRR